MTEAIKLDLDAIEAAAKGATQGDWGHYSPGATASTNPSGAAFLIGPKRITMDRSEGFLEADAAHIAAAQPKVVLELIRRLRAAEVVIHARIAQVPKDAAVVALIGDFTHEHVDLLKGFHNALRAQHNPTALVMCLQSPADIEVLDADQMRKVGWVRTPEQKS